MAVLSHGLAAHRQSCQTFLGFINQVMSRVWAGVSALALVPVKTDPCKKPRCVCRGSREPQPAPRWASLSLVTPQEEHWKMEFGACVGAAVCSTTLGLGTADRGREALTLVELELKLELSRMSLPLPHLSKMSQPLHLSRTSLPWLCPAGPHLGP